MTQAESKPFTPWWRVGTMWLVLGGPTAVVAAGVVTMVLAFRGGDVPIDLKKADQSAAMTPAILARNHAAAPRP